MSKTDVKPRVGVFKRSWLLTKSAWQVLILDKELLALPIIGIILSFSVLILTFVIAVSSYFAYLAITHKEQATSTTLHFGPLWFIGLALFVILMTFISNFISGAIIHGALDRFKGNDPTVLSSLAAAKKQIKAIFLFSVLTATVGLVLQIIQERLPFAGKLFVWLGEMAWAVATFFALPFIMMAPETLGPIDATKKSTNLIKKVWGESLVTGAGVGLLSLLAVFLYAGISIPLLYLSFKAGGTIAALTSITAFIGFTGLMILFSVLSAIIKSAVFYWATTGKAPETFNKELLHAALKPKKARKIFSV